MLSEIQKKLTSYAITALAILVLAAFAVFVIKALAVFLNEFYFVLLPIFLAIVLSYITEPAVIFISKRLELSKKSSALALFAAVFVFVLAVIAVGVPYLVEQAATLSENLPRLARNAADYFAENTPRLKAVAEKILGDSANSVLDANAPAAATAGKAAKIIRAATSEISLVGTWLAALAVVPVYLYYILISDFDFYAWLETRVGFIPENARGSLIFFLRRFSEIMQSFFRGQLLVAAIMGLLLGAGLAITGVKFGFLLGFAAGLLNIIPYFGTMIGLSTILPMAFFQDGGSFALAAGALAIFVAVQLVEGYYLTPKIMGNKTGLHPTVVIFSVFFWGTALHGILGMILGIPFSAFFAAAYPEIQEFVAEKLGTKMANRRGENPRPTSTAEETQAPQTQDNNPAKQSPEE